MAPHLETTPGPSVSDVVFRTLRNMPADTKRGLSLALAAWAIVLALQVWDSWGRPGAHGVAELASVVVGTAGVLLIGLAEVLRRAEEPYKPPPSVLGMDGSDSTVESPAVRQVLMTLPTLGVLAGGCLAAAVVILIARVWLGTSPVILAIAAFYGAAFVAAVQVVKNASRRASEPALPLQCAEHRRVARRTRPSRRGSDG